MLRGKVTLLFIVCAVLLAIPAIALADALRGDADSDALAAPGANDVAANQAPGSTAAYDFSAFVEIPAAPLTTRLRSLVTMCRWTSFVVENG